MLLGRLLSEELGTEAFKTLFVSPLDLRFLCRILKLVVKTSPLTKLLALNEDGIFPVSELSERCVPKLIEEFLSWSLFFFLKDVLLRTLLKDDNALLDSLLDLISGVEFDSANLIDLW